MLSARAVRVVPREPIQGARRRFVVPAPYCTAHLLDRSGLAVRRGAAMELQGDRGARHARRRIYPAVLLGIGLLAAVAVWLLSSRTSSGVSAKIVKGWVDHEVPIGSSEGQVCRFFQRHRISYGGPELARSLSDPDIDSTYPGMVILGTIHHRVRWGGPSGVNPSPETHISEKGRRRTVPRTRWAVGIPAMNGAASRYTPGQ